MVWRKPPTADGRVFEATEEAGNPLEGLPQLWEEANLNEKHWLLLTMLGAGCVDRVEEQCIVASMLRPAFRPLFGKPLGNGPSDSSVGSRDESNLILEKHLASLRILTGVFS